jgi:hypothetical protein
MNTNNIIDEIVKSKKERFHSLGIQENLNYLFFESDLKYWNSYQLSQPDYWVENFKKLVTDKPVIQGIVKVKDVDYDSYLIELDTCIFKIEVTKNFRSSFVDSHTSYGDFFLYYKDKLVCEIGMSKYTDEFGSTTSFSNLEGFIEGDWVVDLNDLVTRLKTFFSVICKVSEQIQIEQRNEILKNKFGITDSEVKGYLNNSSDVNNELIHKTTGYYFGYGLVKIFKYITTPKSIINLILLIVVITLIRIMYT